MYKNKQTIIPSEIREKFDVDENTIIEWGVDEHGKPQINFRKKITLKDVAGMIKKKMMLKVIGILIKEFI